MCKLKDESSKIVVSLSKIHAVSQDVDDAVKEEKHLRKSRRMPEEQAFAADKEQRRVAGSQARSETKAAAKQ